MLAALGRRHVVLLAVAANCCSVAYFTAPPTAGIKLKGRNSMTSTSAVPEGEALVGVDPCPSLVPAHLEAHTSCLTLKLGQVIFRLMESQIAQFGLKIRHYSVLGTLLDPGPISQQDLGTYLRIDSATMVATIDDLEGRGLVARTRGLRDRRRYIVSITPEGREMLERIDKFAEEFDEVHFADITPTQRAQLHRTLTKLSRGKTLVTAFDAARNS
jgi:DNA-binding MarR family transcriptional regulator